MKISTKYILLTILGITGFVDGFLLYASMNPHIMMWFNPFMGMLYLVILPFWGAMISLFPTKEAA